MATLDLAVDGVGATDDFTLVAGASKTAAVAVPDDDDTSYILGVVVAQDLTFATSALLTGASISNVRVVLRVKGSVGDPEPFFQLVSGTPSAEQILAVGLSWAAINVDFPLAPDGSAWTKAAIDAAYIHLNAGGGTLAATTVYLTVTYTLGSSGVYRLPILGIG